MTGTAVGVDVWLVAAVAVFKEALAGVDGSTVSLRGGLAARVTVRAELTRGAAVYSLSW